MNNIPTFYFVYGVGEDMPRHTHITEESADAEAERLASTNPGTVFVVLETRDPSKGFMQQPPEKLDTYDLRRKLSKLFPLPRETEEALTGL